MFVILNVEFVKTKMVTINVDHLLELRYSYTLNPGTSNAWKHMEVLATV